MNEKRQKGGEKEEEKKGKKKREAAFGTTGAVNTNTVAQDHALRRSARCCCSNDIRRIRVVQFWGVKPDPQGRQLDPFFLRHFFTRMQVQQFLCTERAKNEGGSNTFASFSQLQQKYKCDLSFGMWPYNEGIGRRTAP